MPTVTLYTKPGCCLCVPVEQTIHTVRSRRPFTFEKVNILDDPDAFARYRHAIPVVTLDGREIARHRLTEQQLNTALDAAPAS